MNRAGVLRLWPYMILGVALWVLVLRSGVHATLAGVVLALAIPLRARVASPDDHAASPLHRLEHGLHIPVGFIVVPIFGLAMRACLFSVCRVRPGGRRRPWASGWGCCSGKVGGDLRSNHPRGSLRACRLPRLRRPRPDPRHSPAVAA
jgi:hypothetical protein